MTTDTTERTMTAVDRSALIDAIRDAAEQANNDWTHVAVCVNDVHLRATRRWYDQCDRCGEPIPNGNVGPYTWCDGPPNSICYHGAHSWFQHGCGESNWPTEVEIDLWEAIPDEVELDDPEDFACWAEDYAAELVERVVRMLDDACTSEQQDEAERIEDRLRAQVREARKRLDAYRREHGIDVLAEFAAVDAYRDPERYDEIVEMLHECEVYYDPTEPDVFVEDDGRLGAWDWDPRSIDPETGAYSDWIEVGEDERGQA